MSAAIEQYLLEKLEQRKSEHNYRTLLPASSLIDFTSNDYLGLARDEAIREAVLQEIKSNKLPFGSTGSRLLSGNSEYAEQVEQLLARYHHAEAALLFHSGYTANYGLLSALPYRGDTILYDELVHASIHDGIRASKANKMAFRHNSVADLQAKLTSAQGKIFVVVESLYSMDGDCAPLKAISAACESYDAGLIVDEAHATGVFGKRGEGFVDDEGLGGKCLARIHTFGKAIGGLGAVILGSRQLRHFLINYCRPFIFSTALPFYALAHIRTVFDRLDTEPIVEKRRRLFEAIGSFKAVLREAKHIEVTADDTQIQSVVCSGNEAVIRLAQKLQHKGFDVRPIKYPTVAKGRERIRVCLHSFNSTEEVKQLAGQICQL